MGPRDTLRRVAPLVLSLLVAACSVQRAQSGEVTGDSTDGQGSSTDGQGSSTDDSGDSNGGSGHSLDPVDCGALDGSEIGPTAYRQVAASQDAICALTDVGSIRCWSSEDYLEADPEPINDRCFRRMALGGGWGGADFVCGLDETGRPHCMATASGSVAETPALALTSLVAGGDFACGLDDDGAATCWWVDAGLDSGHSSEAREGLMAGGPYDQISAGWEVACGLSGGGEIACFGQDRYGEVSQVPTGAFDRVFAFGLSVCALDTAGALHCWGGLTDEDLNGALVPEVGPRAPEIVEVSGDLYGLCWRSVDGMLHCAGSSAYEALTGGPFDQVDGGLGAICGLEPDGAVVCTSWNDPGWTSLE